MRERTVSVRAVAIGRALVACGMAQAENLGRIGPTYPIAEQNGVCMSCHEPKPLREALWAHDVHATKLTCTSCHQLHPAKEPMAEIPEKSRIKLCVDCHSKQHQAKVAGLPNNAGKEAP